MAKPTLAVIRSDDYMSAVTQVGTSLGDKVESVFFAYQELPTDLLEELWAQEDITARIVETLPELMLREGYEVVIPAPDGDSEAAADDAKATSEMLVDLLDEMDADSTIQDALNTERALGGGAILLGAEDGSADPAQPLNENTLRSLDWLTVLTRDELKPLAYYDDPREPKYGQVRLYSIQRRLSTNLLVQLVPSRGNNIDPLSGMAIHESRLIRLPGIRLPRRLANMRHGWGGSVIERCYHRVRDFGISWKAAAHLLQDFSQAVLGIKGLANQVNAGNNSIISNRATQAAVSRSVARMLVIDADETFERKATPMGGMPEMLQAMAQRVAAAARMPVTVLMGMSPAGLNATGESDIRLFYDSGKTAQKQRLRPILNRIVQLKFRSKEGPTGGREPENWRLKFRPLWQLTDEQRANVRLTMAKADQLNVQSGITAAEEIAVSRYGGDEFSLDTVLDEQARGALSAAAEEEVQPVLGGSATADPALNDPEAVDPRTALNGAQVSSMVEIITLVAKGDLPRETGVELLTAAFPLTRQQADKIMGPVGKGFKVEPAPVPPAFGQAPKPNVQNISLNSEEP
jgi:phage-related protein (TIGR01555 family)